MNALDVQRAVSVSKEADKIQLYYNVYLYAMLFVSLISVATSIVSRKSFKDVGPEFRYIALHLLGTSLVVMTGFSLWQPVILVPLIGSYSVGILDWLGPSGSIFGLWMTLISMGHLGMTFALGFLLQSYQLKIFGDKTALFEWLNTGRNTLKFLNWSIIFHGILSFPFIATLHTKQLDLHGIPELRQIVAEHPSTIVIDIKNNSTLILVSFLAGLILSSLEMLCCLVGIIQIYRTIRSTSKIVQARTLQIQMQIYRVFSLRLLVAFLFFYLPMMLGSLVLNQVVDFKIPNLWNICVCIICWHCPIQSMITFLRFSVLKTTPTVSPSQREHLHLYT